MQKCTHFVKFSSCGRYWKPAKLKTNSRNPQTKVLCCWCFPFSVFFFVIIGFRLLFRLKSHFKLKVRSLLLLVVQSISVCLQWLLFILCILHISLQLFCILIGILNFIYNSSFFTHNLRGIKYNPCHRQQPPHTILCICIH